MFLFSLQWFDDYLSLIRRSATDSLMFFAQFWPGLYCHQVYQNFPIHLYMVLWMHGESIRTNSTTFSFHWLHMFCPPGQCYSAEIICLTLHIYMPIASCVCLPCSVLLADLQIKRFPVWLWRQVSWGMLPPGFSKLFPSIKKWAYECMVNLFGPIHRHFHSIGGLCHVIQVIVLCKNYLSHIAVHLLVWGVWRSYVCLACSALLADWLQIWEVCL